MNDIAIHVENLSKLYRIGAARIRHDTLRDQIASMFKRAASDPLQRSGEETVWALRDVSFEVRRGEVVGIIGRNGAGKSTLLKVLSRITEPTSGRGQIRGRLGTLLEVGTGFHAELTGRENIYLSGAILGMRKAEIDRKFDEIVAFSEIEKFLDTPVKRYSSGMYVRLAFAVAAHLDTEVLLMDEVLAVGDREFQKKCLGRMSNVTREGRTILFVSHQMDAVANLCNRCMLLDNGSILSIGDTSQTIDKYLSLSSSKDSIPLSQRTDRSGDGRLRFTDAWIENGTGQKVKTVQTGQTIKIVLAYETKPGELIKNLQVAIGIYSLSNVNVTELCNNYSGHYFVGPMPSRGRIECVLPRLPINRGTYTYNIAAEAGSQVALDYVIGAGQLDIESGDFFGTGRTAGDDRRLVLLEQQWTWSELN